MAVTLQHTSRSLRPNAQRVTNCWDFNKLIEVIGRGGWRAAWTQGGRVMSVALCRRCAPVPMPVHCPTHLVMIGEGRLCRQGGRAGSVRAWERQDTRCYRAARGGVRGGAPAFINWPTELLLRQPPARQCPPLLSPLYRSKLSFRSRCFPVAEAAVAAARRR